MNGRALVVIFLLGALVGYVAAAWQDAPAPEPPAVAVVQQDASVVLERAPDAHARAVHAIPAGGRVERIVRVVVQPRAVTLPDPPAAPAADTAQSPACNATGPPVCPPVSVDLSLVRMPDASRRVVASSADGQVISGVDIPIEPIPVPRQQRWQAQLLLSDEQQIGLQVTHLRGPFVLSLSAVGGSAWLGVGIRF